MELGQVIQPKIGISIVLLVKTCTDFTYNYWYPRLLFRTGSVLPETEKPTVLTQIETNLNPIISKSSKPIKPEPVTLRFSETEKILNTFALIFCQFDGKLPCK